MTRSGYIPPPSAHSAPTGAFLFPRTDGKPASVGDVLSQKGFPARGDKNKKRAFPAGKALFGFNLSSSCRKAFWEEALRR